MSPQQGMEWHKGMTSMRRSERKKRIGIANPLLEYCHVGSATNEKIQNIPTRGGLGLIELGITTLSTANGDELFILHVKNFGEISTCGLKLIANVLCITAFGADKLLFFHRNILPIFIIASFIELL